MGVTHLLILLACFQGTELPANAAWPLRIETQHRPGTYFWIPGSAWDRAGIDWNLEQLAQAGYGIVHLVPIYAAKAATPKPQPYLGEEWGRHYDHLLQRASALGLQVDMTTGTGWCFGGPDLDGLADAGLRWDPAAGKVVATRGRAVKRAAPGGRGMMLDSFNPAAMRSYLERFDCFFARESRARPRAQYHDSYEYVGKWSPVIPQEFARRRGYDLEPYLADLYGGARRHPAGSVRLVRQDLNRTLSELHAETMRVWHDWAHGRGMITRNQAHGAPANVLDTYAQATIPETEVFRSPAALNHLPGFLTEPDAAGSGSAFPSNIQLAASAAHVAHAPGSQLVAMEAFTWLREHWHATLHQLKLAADLYFGYGVNHLFYHGYCYSPPDEPWPGWYFYASTQANPRNTIWRDIGTLNAYIARCQSILQRGRPDQDVLVYWPIHDLWAEHTTPHIQVSDRLFLETSAAKTMQRLRKAGFAGDYVSDAMLGTLRASGGPVVAPGGTYAAVVVPRARYLPLESARALQALREQGARVFFVEQVPAEVPGLHRRQARQASFDAVRSPLEADASVGSMDELLDALAGVGRPERTLAALGCSWIRRRDDSTRDYFIANHGAAAIDRWVGLSRSAESAALLDPMTGLVGQAAWHDDAVYLQLAPGESVVVRLTEAPTAAPWPYRSPVGIDAPTITDWRGEFGPPRYGARPPPLRWEGDPRFWTETNTHQHFSGTASYTSSFAHAPGPGRRSWILDCGDARGSIRVHVNDRLVRTLLGPPYRCDISPALRPGSNALRLEVTSRSANAIRAMSRDGHILDRMKDINIVDFNYRKFDPTAWPVRAAGIAGPVRVVPHEALRPSRQ